MNVPDVQNVQNGLLIVNGIIVNADEVVQQDIYIEDGIVKNIGLNLRNIVTGDPRVIDANGKYVIPGGIDPHTHLEFDVNKVKSADSFFQGTKAAIAGGTTMVIDFALPKRRESLIAAYKNWREIADREVCCDYSLHVGVTWWSDKVKEEIETLCKEHGVNSFKVYMGYTDVFKVDDSDLFSIFKTCKAIGGIVQIHAGKGRPAQPTPTTQNIPESASGSERETPPWWTEDCRQAIQERKRALRRLTQHPTPQNHINYKKLRSKARRIITNAKTLLAEGIQGVQGTEAETVGRACAMASKVNCPLYVTCIFTKASGNVIKQKRSQGLVVFGEVLVSSFSSDGTYQSNKCWQYSDIEETTPIVPDSIVPEHLLDLLASDDLQLTASDHCTYFTTPTTPSEEDQSKVPSGVNGVEDRMSVIWEKGVQSGKINPEQFVAITSTNAAKIFNIYPRKGCIGIGSDADIVIWDPTKTRTVSSKTHHHAINVNIFEGMVCHGVPEYVIVNGCVCVDEGTVNCQKGYGKFIPTAAFPSFVYDKIKDKDDAKEKKNLE